MGTLLSQNLGILSGKEKDEKKSDKKENETKERRRIKCSYGFPLNGGSRAGSQKEPKDPLDLGDILLLLQSFLPNCMLFSAPSLKSYHRMNLNCSIVTD